MAVARASCLYCGASLPAESVAAAAASKVREASVLAAAVLPAGTEAEERQLLIVDVRDQTATVLERALGLGPFEVEMRLRLGGLQLLRRGAMGELGDEAKRLEGAGLSVFLVAESEARHRAIPVLGGRPERDVLRLRGEEGTVEIAAKDLLLIVHGPIRREYQARETERKKPLPANLEDGHRFHLHRRVDPRPVELDPASFAFGAQAPLTGSSFLEIRAWLEAMGDGVTVDDRFKRLSPALGAAAEEDGSLRTLRGGRSSGRAERRDALLVLDNVAQFRFYSGWRAAIERRLAR